MNVALGHSAFLYGISNVVLMVAKKKAKRAYAKPGIAAVTYKEIVGNRAKMHYPAYPVGHKPFCAQRKQSVPESVLFPSPKPTAIRRSSSIHLGPEAGLALFRNFRQFSRRSGHGAIMFGLRAFRSLHTIGMPVFFTVQT